MSIGEALILGLVQGLTEFLPVSSSGHLVLAQDLLDVRAADDVGFNAFVHLGTLMSVFVVLRRDVMRLVAALLNRLGGRGRRDAAAERTILCVVIGVVPVAVVGVLFESRIESAFARPDLVACMLIVTAVILIAPLLQGDAKRGTGEIGVGRAMIIGISQAAAIVPGISRSGTTISTGIVAGADRDTAGTFSFLLAIPAILGAIAFKARDIGEHDPEWAAWFCGCLMAFVSGIAALHWLLALVRRGRLWFFSPYLVVVGVAFLVFRG